MKKLNEKEKNVTKTSKYTYETSTHYCMYYRIIYSN